MQLSTAIVPTISNMEAIKVLREFVVKSKATWRIWTQTGDLQLDGVFDCVWEGIRNQNVSQDGIGRMV